VEKDGTFANCHGRVQRIAPTGSPVFPPLGDSREDWRTLLELARMLGQRIDWQGPPQIFEALARSIEPFAGLSYDTIGPHGAPVATVQRPDPDRRAELVPLTTSPEKQR
jgi:formate dehydrogenase major subunit